MSRSASIYVARTAVYGSSDAVYAGSDAIYGDSSAIYGGNADISRRLGVACEQPAKLATARLKDCFADCE